MNYLIGVDDFFIDRPGGAARVAWDMACMMRDRHHKVCLISLNTQDGMGRPDQEIYEEIEIIRCNRQASTKGGINKYRNNIIAASRNIEKYISKRNWDIVHIHSLVTGEAIRLVLGDAPGYVYTMHSPLLNEQQINWRQKGLGGRLKLLLGSRKLLSIERNILSACDKIHTLSDYTKSWIEHYHSMSNKVEVIPHWIRGDYKRIHSITEARRVLGLDGNVKIVFTLRRLVARMGLDTAIKAIAPLAKEGKCIFLVGGDGPLLHNLQKLALKLGCGAEQIIFLGRINDDELKLYYQSSDLFLLPTKALECFGLIVLESLSMGCPVLGTRVGAIPEILCPLASGFLVPPDDVESMRSQMVDILDNREQYPDMDELIEYVNSKYRAEVIIPTLSKFLEE